MSRTAKATLAASFVFAVGIIVGVHIQQQSERETMFKGVLRDDERRREKMNQREADLQESQRKRQIYEAVQKVGMDGGPASTNS